MNKEQIESLASRLMTRDAGSSESKFKIITEWIEQNPPKPVVVGLSDEQFKKVARHLANGFDSDDYIGYEAELRRALGEHSFAQPNYDEKYMELYDDYQSLLIDNSLLEKKFTPDWSTAPEGVTVFRVFSDYLNENMSTIHDRVTLCEEQRPTPPVPKVVFNVDYIYKNAKYSVKSTGQMKVGDEWIDCVNYTNDDHSKDYTRTLSDFLAKFKRVQP